MKKPYIFLHLFGKKLTPFWAKSYINLHLLGQKLTSFWAFFYITQIALPVIVVIYTTLTGVSYYPKMGKIEKKICYNM